jgi:hypothetical protein
MNQCVERCTFEFGRCLTHSSDPNQCLAHRQSCLNGCANMQFPDDDSSGGYTDEQCGYGPCDSCENEYYMTNVCAQPRGHSDQHACSYYHTWY